MALGVVRWLLVAALAYKHKHKTRDEIPWQAARYMCIQNAPLPCRFIASYLQRRRINKPPLDRASTCSERSTESSPELRRCMSVTNNDAPLSLSQAKHADFLCLAKYEP